MNKLFLRSSGLTLALALLLLAPLPSSGAVVGAIAGLVSDERGIPQMGATVLLLNAEGRALRRVYTNDRGAFLIDNLFPGLYAVRVSLHSFLPALKEKILVQPGAHSYLEVQLANLFSSIQLVYPRPGDWTDMTEDWKWALRTASSTRPVLRLLPWEDKEKQSVLRKFTGAFGDTQGLLQLSAGEGGRASGLGSESDLGTAFAVATSLFGSNNVLVSGNLGYGSSRGTPSAGFHTSYSREMPYGAQPEVSITVRQLFLPVAAGQALFGPESHNGAVLQTFTLGFQDHIALGDQLKLEYGFLYDSVNFVDRLNYVSPFGKLSYKVGEDTQVILRYAGGVPHSDFDAAGAGALSRNLSSLGLYPRLTVRGGRPALQRGEHMEAAVERKIGANTVELAAYHDTFSNTALTAIVPPGMYAEGDILPDLFSQTSSLNAGSYKTTGYRVSYSRRLGDYLRANVAYGLGGVLVAGRDAVSSSEPAELRSILKPVREQTVTTQFVAQVPQAHTWLSSSYQWGSRTAITAPDLFNISGSRALPGMNLVVRQPLPEATYIPGKFEATAEFRNLLAHGYVPIRTADGSRMFLIQSARSFRGGLNFIF
ncbi:MAG: TonB-dependent receptor [Acidobacteria bacterium]|nr:TonB-dependent receptor [Acidobacteriota bacterium]